MQNAPPPSRAPRVRSYVTTGTYTPKSGPLAGQTFTGAPGTSQGYNLYQQARARALGFLSYGEERRARTAYAHIFRTEKDMPRFGQVGTLNAQHRTEIMQNIAKYWSKEHGTVDTYLRDSNGELILGANGKPVQDKSYGGKLDMYLRGLNRRTGTETWAPGETPK